jgi:prepilin-type N-terminal cleavage/methylation domain-containing protein
MVPVRCPVGSGFASLPRKHLIRGRYLIVSRTGIPQSTTLRRIPCEMSLLESCGRHDRRAFPPPGRTANAVLTLPHLLRRPPPRCRRGFTLLELLVVLVLLGLGAAFVLPTLQLPARRSADAGTIERARALAIRRGESMRLAVDRSGAWTVRATADTTAALLLSGAGAIEPGVEAPFSIVITALGACLPEGSAFVGAGAWDPTRCTEARR